jgi:hypothetical protein
MIYTKFRAAIIGLGGGAWRAATLRERERAESSNV